MTLGNLSCGFLAMAKVVDGTQIGGIGEAAVVAKFEVAALLLFLGMLLDALDGRVARMTGQTSQFGAQLDSLADVVAFGVAPALCAKVLIDLHSPPDGGLLPFHPRVYYFCAAVFALCAAMRLARFNVENASDQDDHVEFRGLPTPGAAAVVASLLLFWATRDDAGGALAAWIGRQGLHAAVVVAMPFLLVVLGLLMVGRMPYPHAFGAVVRGGHSFPFLATVVVLGGVFVLEWQVGLVLVSLGYLISGPWIALFRRRDRGADFDADGDGDAAEESVARAHLRN